MIAPLLWEPLRAYWARKRLERLHYETAAALLQRTTGSRPAPLREGTPVEDDPDAADWQLIGGGSKGVAVDPSTLRDKARYLADYNPYARNILLLHRNYVVGTGMRHEVTSRPLSVVSSQLSINNWEQGSPAADGGQRTVATVAASLWADFLAANDWHTGQRKDWEYCLRTWRDGECFLRLFRQPTWPPLVHFIDPERIAPDPRTGLPTSGIETAPANVEMPLAYYIHQPLAADTDQPGTAQDRIDRVEADLMLHTKIGVDANVKRGVSLFLPVVDALKRFQGWLDVELIQRKLASSIVLIRKHTQNYPGGLSAFADSAATERSGSTGALDAAARRVKIQPGSIIDAQGFDLQFLSPDTHFEDASLLGRMILLSIAAGIGLPEFMVTADASNANYASTLVAEGPAVRHFAAWQSFFIGQWQRLFGMVLAEAIRLGLLPVEAVRQVALRITPPPLAVRNRHLEAQADALYYDRGALSAHELARRDGADPDLMARERKAESPES